ncbi:MAG: MlaD family protein, partial [Myxococcota bacterium]
MSDLPTPRVEKDSARRISAIWAIPAVAVAIALTLAVQSYMSRGPVIEITFPTASGIEAGKTPLKYRDVEVGRVESIALEATQEQVVVRVRLQNEVADFVDADARFWVVEPRLSVSEVSGLETLLSGAYLQGSWDSEPGEYAFRFAGLEEPPLTPPGTPGRRITLRSPAGATVTPGAPVFFKHVPVGRIESERFSDDGSAVEYQVFVDAPHHRRLTRATKFWNAGGLNVTIGVDGISTGIESLESFLSGGVAFDTLLLVDEVALPEIRDGAVFRLHPNESAAQNSAFAEGTGVRFTVTFSESVRGLREGAPVENDGIRVGEVVEVLASLGDKPGELNKIE